MANKITTIFDADARGFRAGIKGIKKDIKEADGAIGKMRAGIKSSVGEFRTNNAAQAAVIAGLGAAAFKAIGHASDLEESINAVTVTFGDAADEVLKIGENSAKSFGLSQSEFNSLAVSFSAFAKQVAGPGGDVAGTIEDMATRTADFASVMNLDLATATQVFQSSLAGQTEPIRRYGKDLSAAAVTQFALAEGLIETKAGLTEAIKVQARYGLLMRETADTAGDFTNTSDSLANSQRILSAQATDLAASVGEGLAPALEMLVTGGQSLIEVIEAVHLDDLIGQLAKIDDAAFAAGRGVRKFFGGDVAEPELSDDFDAITRAVNDFDKSLLAGVTTYKEAEAVALEYAESVNLGADAQTAANFIAVNWNKTLGQSAEVTALTAEAAEKAAARTANYTHAGLILERELDAIHGQSDEVTEAFEDTADAADDAAKRVEDLTEAFSELDDQMSDRSAWLDVEDAIDDYERAVEGAAAATEEFGVGSREADAANRDAERSLMSRKQAVIDYIKEVDSLPAERVTEIKALLDRGSVAEAEEVLRMLERNRSAVLTLYTKGGSNQFVPAPQTGPNNANSTSLVGATGGIVNRPTSNITLGEAGPEAVIPLDQSPGNSPLGNLGLGGGNTTVNLTVVAGALSSGPEVGQLVVDALEEFYRSGGRPPRSQ